MEHTFPYLISYSGKSSNEILFEITKKEYLEWKKNI